MGGGVGHRRSWGGDVNTVLMNLKDLKISNGF